MTPRTLSLDLAAERAGIPYEHLRILAKLGQVPGATQRGHGTRWEVDALEFGARLDVVREAHRRYRAGLGVETQKHLPGVTPRRTAAIVRDVVRRELRASEQRAPETGLPVVVACDESLLDAAKVEVAEARARGALVTLTDHATVEPIMTVQEHLDRQAREARATVCPWWLTTLIAVLGGAVVALIVALAKGWIR